MADTVRQRIIDAIDARLKTILIENGYQTDIGNKVKNWQAEPTLIDNLTEPELEYRDIDVDTKEGQMNDVPVGMQFHTMKVTIEARAKGADCVDFIRTIEGDIFKAIGEEGGTAQGNWNNLAPFTFMEHTTIRVQQEGEKVAALTVAFIIQFRTLAWDLYTAR